MSGNSFRRRRGIYGVEPESDVVDVRRADGLFQQGRIVDRIEDGLMIDWECQKPATLTPFGEIYLHIRKDLYVEWAFRGQELPVQVLLRRSPEEPKTWYRGTLLTERVDVFHQFRFVRITFPDGIKVVLVPGHRVRRPPTQETLQTLRVDKGHFIKQRLYLPKKFCRGEAFAQELLEALNLNCRGTTSRTNPRTLIRVVNMDQEWLYCIRIGYNIVPKRQQNHTPAKLHALLVEAAKSCTQPLQQQGKRKLSETELESASEEEATPDKRSTPACGIQILAKPILAGIFEHLDSAEQCLLRRVCGFWNYLLALSCVVRVRYEDNEQNFMSVASLHHGWTSRTTTVISAGAGFSEYGLFCGGQLFRTLMDMNLHAPVQTIVLANMEQNASNSSCGFSGSFRYFVEELNSIAAACQHLLLRNLTVHINGVCAAWPQKGSLILTGRIAGYVTVKELWSRMDDCLPPLIDAQMRQIADWIGNRAGQRTAKIVLQDKQSSDPRDDAHYRGHVWRTADLATLDLHRLSKITLYSLLARSAGRTSMKFPISW